MTTNASSTPYLHQWHIDHFDELPIKNAKRRCTDICSIFLFAAFVLALLIASLILFDAKALRRTHLPADSNGTICADTAYPYLYFDQDIRVCLQECPQQFVAPNCYQGCKVAYYPNTAFERSMGLFCLPKDSSARNSVLSKAGAVSEWNYWVTIKFTFIGTAIAFAFALFLALFLCCFPATTIAITLVFCILCLFALAILLICTNLFPLSTLLAIVCILLAIIIIFYACKHFKQLKFSIPFLQQAASIISKKIAITVIPFILLSIAFAALLVFQYYALLSSNPLTTDLSQAYSTQSISTIQVTVLLIEAIWGFSIIRDSYYFVIGAWTVQKYCNKSDSCSVSELCCTHLGSVVSGSFLNGFFYIPALLVQLTCPEFDHCLCNTLSLVRTQAYTYIYLTGNSYCESVRQCEYLAKKSKIVAVHQSLIEICALGAHLLVASFTLLLVVGIADTQIIESAPNSLLIAVGCAAFYIASYIIDLQLYVAEALTLCYLAETDLQHQQMVKCPPSLFGAFR